MRLKGLLARIALMTGATLVGLWPLFAQAWWNDQWSYRKGLTLDTGPQGAALGEALSDTAVLVRLHTGNFQYFLDVKDGGADLRFIAGDDMTPLDYHVERFDPINELAYVWVKVPRLDPNASGEKIWMYYGNPVATAGADPGGTFDTPTGLVYHFGDQGGVPQDATAYANHATAFGGLMTPASIIGGGARFLGDGSLEIPASPALALDPANGWTFSTWVKLDGPVEQALLMDWPADTGRLQLHIDATTAYAGFTPTGGAGVETPRLAALTPGTWHHLALVAGAGRLAVYLDGSEAAAVETPLAPLSGPITVGSAAGGGQYFSGELDELRIANVARDPQWLATAAGSQGANPRLLSYGVDESPDSAGGESAEEGGHGGSFGLIFQSVFGNQGAIVEQVVIGICVLMMFISLLVMLFKSLYLSAAASANRRFLRAFAKLGTEEDLAALVGQKRHRKSPLYQLYCQGMEQVRLRRSPSVGAAAAGLDAKGMTTIKAAMDAVQVREGQRLNAQMVLLTIAISGGPFIGLLGTVVGVMVTFAAIAATGDVNIAAIAPGMAAALLATVAGLGVAIPSLFGYNYLGSRVKEISADMQVFSDELVARIGEAYGR